MNVVPLRSHLWTKVVSQGDRLSNPSGKTACNGQGEHEVSLGTPAGVMMEKTHVEQSKEWAGGGTAALRGLS